MAIKFILASLNPSEMTLTLVQFKSSFYYKKGIPKDAIQLLQGEGPVVKFR